MRTFQRNSAQKSHGEVAESGRRRFGRVGVHEIGSSYFLGPTNRSSRSSLDVGDSYAVLNREARKTWSRWNSRNRDCPDVNKPTSTSRSTTTPIFARDGLSATGDTSNRPSSRNEMNP